MSRNSPRRERFRSAPLILLAAIANIGAAEVYRWQDENGTVTYSTTKPRGQKSQLVDVDDSASRASPTAPTQDLTAAAAKAREERLARTAKDAEEKKAAADRNQLCARAQANLEGMDNNVRAFHVDQSGERVRIGEEQRQEDIAKLQALVAKYCD